MFNKENIVIRLELIASKARVLASDLERNRLWEGELELGLLEMLKEVRETIQETK